MTYCRLLLPLLVLTSAAAAQTTQPAAPPADPPGTGSVIFIHPDGTSAGSWAVARNLYHGPDGDLHWDRLPAIALYRGHMSDSLTATSNGGATVHAYGVKVRSNAFGMTGGEDPQPITDANGKSLSVMHQAMRAGLPVGVVQTGVASEPGTACFLASAKSRGEHENIVAQIVESGADVILGGGEKYFLPEGTSGRWGQGVRKDGRNLLKEAEEAGYTVIRTRDELLNLSADTDKVLGVFAHGHTFNDRPEEELRAAGEEPYDPDAPTVAQMTDAALKVLSNKGRRFLLVVEEEGTDNLGNKNNASGTLEAMRRADEAIGVARAFVAANPRTLVLTAADSDAGGMRLVGIDLAPGEAPPRNVPAWNNNGAPLDGVAGRGTAPFIAAPDRQGRTLPFAVAWAAQDDVTGAILVRGEGLNSHLVRGSMDNTELPELMRLTLFGTARP